MAVNTTPAEPHHMRRTDRLFHLLQILRDGKLHTAQEMACALGVSQRTLYRDMETLQASGVPVSGARGVGYQITQEIGLPPLTLTPDELEALQLGLAIVSEAADAALNAAARSLGDKLDAVLPERNLGDAAHWRFAVYPFADAVRGAAHMATLRAAIKARQKLSIRSVSYTHLTLPTIA